MDWIKNEIPKKDEWVLVTDGKYMSVAQLCNGEWQDINGYSIQDITHWRTLPNQPERSKREDPIPEYGSESSLNYDEWQRRCREKGCGALNTMET